MKAGLTIFLSSNHIELTLRTAHWIRNQSSIQFKAAKALISPRRWCLTGTPIQNRMGDLIALLDFLHFEPFSKKHIFEQHILDPLSRDTPDRASRLHALLRTICLRRTEKLLNLPKPIFKQTTVTMSTGERSIYSDVIKACAREIEEVVSTRANKKRIKKYNVLFKGMMRLRRLCNHGTFPTHGIQATLIPSVLEESYELECELCGVGGEDGIEIDGMGEFCEQCGRSRDLAKQHRNAANARKRSQPFANTFASSETDLLRGLAQESPQTYVSTKMQAAVDGIRALPLGSKRYASFHIHKEFG